MSVTSIVDVDAELLYTILSCLTRSLATSDFVLSQSHTRNSQTTHKFLELSAVHLTVNTP